MKEKIYVRLKVKFFQDYLLKNNMSLREFSHKVGYDSAQVSNWLSGKRFIGNIARKKIQDFTKAQWDEIFEIVSEAEIISQEGCG